MPIFPFAPAASTPPGSSHYISNALIIAKRIALGLEDPIRIQFDREWKPGNPLYDWYRRHSGSRIVSMQLRKETRAPFFHEYITIVISIEDHSRCFRIDRRQLPDEQSPMSCVEDEGVIAYDTIEQITNPEDSMYNLSECLVEVKFDTHIELYLMIRICQAISAHTLGRVYTVQKYNCYFYAQTLMLCATCWVDYRDIEYLWKPEGLYAGEAGSGIPDWVNIEPGRKDVGDIHIRISQEVKVSHAHARGILVLRGLRALLRSQRAPTSPLPQLPKKAILRSLSQVSLELDAPSTSDEPSESHSMRKLQNYLSAMISAHADRVEQYKWLTRCTATQVEQDIKQAMNLVWARLHHRSTLGWGPVSGKRVMKD